VDQLADRSAKTKSPRKSANGATHTSLGQKPQEIVPANDRGLKARPIFRQTDPLTKTL
jgi:hypothetical protein